MVSEVQIRRALRDVFGFDGLRPGQSEVIEDVMAGRPVVAVMPTGAGKSLCYQLPAVLLAEQGGLTIVVSPLIALMKDQVDVLTARRVRSAALTSAATSDEQAAILADVRSGALAILFVAPERFASPRFTAALADVRSRIALFAIDEAHCISEWGHEFRPAYRTLGDVVARLAPPRLVALTATATAEVRRDIGVQLGVDPTFHVSGFARPNLRLLVHAVGGAADKRAALIELVRGRDGGSALCYAASRKNAEAYAQALKTAGIRARAYHAGMDDSERAVVQDKFMVDPGRGKLDAVVATNAFGMGIDKADIRLVVHADLPRSPEAYYQEAGRAGRDGAPADCTLLFNYSDVRLQEFLIDATYPAPDVLRALWRLLRDRPRRFQPDALRDALPGRPHASVVESAARILVRHGLLHGDADELTACRPQEIGGDFPAFDPDALERRARVERGKLRSMIDYAYYQGCRHRFLMTYFGDRTRTDDCAACDVCLAASGQPVPALAPADGRQPRTRRRRTGAGRTAETPRRKKRTQR